MSDGPWTAGPWTVRRHTYGRNTLEFAGGGSGTFSLTRTVNFKDRPLEKVVVSGCESLPGAEPTVVVDADVPFGEKVSSIVYEAGDGWAVAPDVEARRWSVLSDPFTGVSVNVVGEELGETTWHSDTTVSWLSVTVGGDPVVDARPEQSPTMALSVFTASRADERRLAAMAGTRRPLLLRHPNLNTDDSWVVLVGDRSQSRIVRRASEQWRRHEWTVHTVSRQHAGARQAANTLGDFVAHYPVLLNLPAGTTFATLQTAVLTSESLVAL